MTANLFDGYVAEAEYARQRGVSVRLLQRERRARQGPPFVKVGTAVYYSVEGIREWLRANTVNTLASQEPATP